MRTERHRAGSRKNKGRKHHGRKRKMDTVNSRWSDHKEWYMGDFHVLCATPNQIPSSSTLDQAFGKVDM